MSLKKIVAFFVLFLLVSFGLSASDDLLDQLPSPPEGMKWQLVWNDEFDGTEIDRSKWAFLEMPRCDGYWSPKCASLDGQGHLKMTLRQDEEGRFAGASLQTAGIFEKAKGYFVARMKLHHEVGHWTAFWLTNACEGNIGNGSVDGAEIDIMETPWTDGHINCAIHWDGYGDEHDNVYSQHHLEKITEGFHNFALWWGDDAYRFYVDGELIWETTAAGICEAPLFIKLTDEVGDWAGDIREANLPDEEFVDFVRVYDLVPIDK